MNSRSETLQCIAEIIANTHVSGMIPADTLMDATRLSVDIPAIIEVSKLVDLELDTLLSDDPDEVADHVSDQLELDLYGSPDVPVFDKTHFASYMPPPPPPIERTECFQCLDGHRPCTCK